MFQFGWFCFFFLILVGLNANTADAVECALDRIACELVCEDGTRNDTTIGTRDWKRCWPGSPSHIAEAERIRRETSLVWVFKRRNSHTIHLQLYSQKRRGWVWPAPQRVWILSNDEIFERSINCKKNEKICYGAWIKNRSSYYWGCGYDCKQGCKDCCYTCGSGRTNTYNLNP